MSRWNTEDFQDSETSVYDTLMIDTSHDIFAQIHEIHNSKNEP
jgi:hypothetical protein